MVGLEGTSVGHLVQTPMVESTIQVTALHMQAPKEPTAHQKTDKIQVSRDRMDRQRVQRV